MDVVPTLKVEGTIKGYILKKLYQIKKKSYITILFN